MYFDGSPKVIGLGVKSEGLVVGGRLQLAAVPDEHDKRIVAHCTARPNSEMRF